MAIAPWHPRAGQIKGTHGMKPQRFWDVDLLVLCKIWIADMGTFLLTAVAFVGMAIPVIIPTLIMWYLYTIDFKMPP